MNTIPFGPRNEDPLLAKAAELPKDVAPARDLWPSIAARLKGETQTARPRALGWPAALAAGFVVASVSALLTFGLMREPDPAAPVEIVEVPRGDTAVMPVRASTPTGSSGLSATPSCSSVCCARSPRRCPWYGRRRAGQAQMAAERRYGQFGPRHARVITDRRVGSPFHRGCPVTLQYVHWHRTTSHLCGALYTSTIFVDAPAPTGCAPARLPGRWLAGWCAHLRRRR